MNRVQPEKFIVSLDIGTTNLKCNLYSEKMDVVHGTREKINVKYSDNGAAEIIPDNLWKSIVDNVEKLISKADISSSQIACLAISSQRCTFTSWDRLTGQPLLNLITWKDSRATDEILKWNNSLLIKVLRIISYCIYMISGSQRFLTGSNLKFTTPQVTIRLLWALQNNEIFRRAVKNGTAMFGTLDTWLLYRLTNGKSFCSDFSCASATGMYDPFTLSWTFLLKILRVPTSILPPVCDSVGTHFGNVSADIWGSEIPITCSIADQSASTFGLHCTNCGDLKLTLGTGGFLSVTVGRKTFSNRNEYLYPLICWKYENIQACMLEGAFNDCGTIVDRAGCAGCFDEVEDLSTIAESVPDSNGVYFKTGSLNSEVQQEDDLFDAAFVGASTGTEKVYLIRAILESIVFQVYQLYLKFKNERQFNNQCSIRVNGGVSNNNFVCQSIANICQVVVSRPSCVEASIRGAALLAGNAVGLFEVSDIEEPAARIFLPDERNGQILRSNYAEWAEY